MKIRTFPPIAAILLLILSVGCAQPDMGLFYSLEKEIKLANRNLNDGLSVNSITLFNNHYFISAGSNKKLDMNASPTDGSVLWSDVTPPTFSGSGTVLTTGTATAFGKLYSAYTEASSGKAGLFSAQSDVTVEWTPVPITGFAQDGTMGIDGLVSANGKLFVFASRSGTVARSYFLYVSSDGVTFSRLISETAEKPVPFIDADFDGTNYWFMTSDTVFSSTNPSVVPSEVGIGGTKKFGGLAYITDGTAGQMFVSTQDGKIFRNGTGAWAQVGNIVEKFEKAVRFTDFSYYVKDSTDILFVGTEGSGYFEISGVKAGTPSVGKPILTGEGYSYSDLNTASVRSFGMNPAKEIIFLGTAGNGLWQNLKRENDGIRIWQQE